MTDQLISSNSDFVYKSRAQENIIQTQFEAQLLDSLIQIKSEAKLSSKELAEKMGISLGTLYKYERDFSKANIRVLVKYIVACNKSIKLIIEP